MNLNGIIKKGGEIVRFLEIGNHSINEWEVVRVNESDDVEDWLFYNHDDNGDFPQTFNEVLDEYFDGDRLELLKRLEI